jgi:hypothetical protein
MKRRQHDERRRLMQHRERERRRCDSGCRQPLGDPPQEDEGMGGQYRDGDAGGERRTPNSRKRRARKPRPGRRRRTRLRMRRAPGNQRPKGSAARSGRPPGRAAERADLVTELDGTPVRDAADLQLRLALLKDRRSRRIRHVAPRRRGDGARREEREPAARYSSRNQASRNTSA